MKRLDDKVALVTGAARGIGEMTARLFASEGAAVTIADVDAELGQKVAEDIGPSARFVTLDVTSADQWQESITKILKQDGRLDILVNNAGVSPAANIEDTTLEQWRQVFKINGDSVFLGCKFGVDAMKKGAGGSIVNLSSITGIRANGDLAAYSASKGAVRLLTKSVALHGGKFQIRCNSIHPGGVHTRMLDDFLNLTPDPAAAKAQMGESVPLGRVGQPIDIANAILFLASDDASWITGAELVVDGGTTL